LNGQFTYLVQAHCQPVPNDCEDRILHTLNQDFAVKSCQAGDGSLSIEIQSGHALAHGVFKDLADAVIQTLSDLDCRVSCGTIYQTCASSGEGLLWSVTSRAIRKALAWALSQPRPAPVFYFYRDVYLDLALEAKARQLQQRQPMEPVAGLN
jgi:hypothetical protein